MRGHIKKRSKNSWTVVVDLGYDTATGQRRQVWRTAYGSKREAEMLQARLITEVGDGLHQTPAKITVSDLLNRWLSDYAKPNTAPRTYERYEQIVRMHLIPALGRLPLKNLRPTHIQAYYARALAQARSAQSDRPLTAQTVVHHHRVLSEALQQGIRWQIMARNPAAGVTPPRVVRREMQVLTPVDAKKLLDACDDDQFRTLIFVALSTGLREGELLGLRWPDVDLERGQLRVQRTLLTLRGGTLQFGEPKTRRSRRQVAISRETVRWLREQRRRQLETRLAAGKAYQDQALVFADAVGEPIKPQRIAPRFKRFVKRAGLPPLRFHDLRHTSASLLLAAGVHPKIVSERLGHSNVNITLDTYSHVLPGLQDAAAELLDQYLPRGR